MNHTQTSPMALYTTKRDSNIELLRIVAMFFIVIHHFLIHSLDNSAYYANSEISTSFVVISFLEGFLYIGVNIFLLISGYYGIHLRARRIWSLYLMSLFYGLVGYLFDHFYTGTPITHTLITKSIFIFSHPLWWYIAYYILLMFLSPILNAGMDHLSKKQYQWLLLCLTFAQVYMGFFWQKEQFDNNGYSFQHFIYFYLVGGYLRRHSKTISSNIQRIQQLFIYVACAFAWAICNILRLYIDIPFGDNWAYNNPIVMLAAIAFFRLFLSFHFQSQVINWMAGGCLAAYLIQDQCFFGNIFYTLIHCCPIKIK